MFKLSDKQSSDIIFDEIIDFDNHKNGNQIFDDQSDRKLILMNSLISPISSINCLKSFTCHGTTEWEQIKQAQESLDTSAIYMNEIESFFQDLSTPRPTPNNCWITQEVSSFALEPFENINFDNLTESNAIDPSIFKSKDVVEFNSDCSNDDSVDTADSDSEVDFHQYKPDFDTNTKRLSSKKKSKSCKQSNTNNQYQTSPSSSTTSNSCFKPPKFYSRSGQIADPNRGPCHNCHTTLTCYWRKLKGEYHCNACTLFYKRNKFHRSEDSADKPIKRRNRKSKYLHHQ